MSRRGRKPKPAIVHLMNGNPSKINLEERFENETDATAIRIRDIPEPPEWLDDVAKKEWEIVAPLLVEIKVLTEADLSAFEMYCKSYSRWKEAEKEMDRMDTTVMEVGENGYLQQLPQVSIAQRYQKICKDWMTEFGLTPSARARGVSQETDEVTTQHEAFKDLL